MSICLSGDLRFRVKVRVGIPYLLRTGSILTIQWQKLVDFLVIETVVRVRVYARTSDMGYKICSCSILTFQIGSLWTHGHGMDDREIVEKYEG